MNERVKHLVLPFVVLAAASVAWSCSGPAQTEITFDDYLSECRHDWVTDSFQVKGFSLAGLNTVTDGRANIPANDCQALVVGSEAHPRYEGIAVVFSVYRPGPFGLTPNDGRAAAVVLAATEYEPLGLQRGWNCVVVRMAGNHDTWGAWSVPIESASECTGQISVGDQATKLSLMQTRRSPGRPYPDVARWGFDREYWLHFVIVGCGPGTCHVAPIVDTTEPIHAKEIQPRPALTKGDPKGRFFAVPLWNDEQFIAAKQPDGTLVPAAWGSIIPDNEFDTLRVAEGDFDEYVRMATVHIDPLPGFETYYKKKLNLEATPDTLTTNVIDLIACDSATGCSDPVLDCSDHQDPHTGRWWKARITPASGDLKTYRCVERCEFPDTVEIPSATRWRWKTDDEMVWFRCDNGCCEVQ